MQLVDDKILLDEEDLREIFSLFSSPTAYEVRQIYLEDSGHYYKQVDLQEEYLLSQEKKEFSFDAWRSILLFLHKKGFTLSKNGNEIALDFIENEMI